MADSLKQDIKPVKSTMIAAYEYDSQAMMLSVYFVSDPDTEHVYMNVSPDVMSAVFDSGGSLGSKFIKRIQRGGYKHSVKQMEDKSDL